MTQSEVKALPYQATPIPRLPKAHCVICSLSHFMASPRVYTSVKSLSIKQLTWTLGAGGVSFSSCTMVDCAATAACESNHFNGLS